MPAFHHDMELIEENNFEIKLQEGTTKFQVTSTSEPQNNIVIFLYQRIKYFTLFYFRKYYTSNSTENHFKRN